VGQKERRAREVLVRRSAVVCCRWMRRRGLTDSAAAGVLGVARSTLSSWQESWSVRPHRLKARGRNAQHACRAERREVLVALSSEGPGAPIWRLREGAPKAARRELEELRARVAYACRRRKWDSFLELEWRRPGAVWAADFSQPPCRIDGEYERLVMVRDLASEAQILAQGAHVESAEEVRIALEGLIVEHGAPLVVKADNGCGFIAHSTREMLERHGVALLASPARLPQYNGSCEAGNGSIKVRAGRIAACAGRAGAWTSDDVEQARLQANALPAPGGPESLSRATRWQSRPPIGDEERSVFQAAFQAELARIQEELGTHLGVLLDRAERDSLARRALVSVLTRHGYLVIRRGRIRPVNRCRKRSAIP